jgi:hypothetical protein
VWAYATRTLTVSAGGATLAEIEGSTVLAKEATVAAKASQASVNAIPTTPLLAANYTAPDNAGIASIKAKTDNLPSSPAAVGSAMMLAATTHTGAVIPRVTLVDTTSTNTDMRGTDGAITSLAGISTKTDIDAALTVVNDNVKLASLFIPATDDIP